LDVVNLACHILDQKNSHSDESMTKPSEH
jgi:hypothetical protein